MKTFFFTFSIISIFFITSVLPTPRNSNGTSSSNFLQSKIFPHKVLSTLKDTVFGKHLLDLVSEKFHNVDEIDSIVQAFDELKGQLQDFQHSEEYSYKKVHKIYENALKKQKEIIDKSIANINSFQSKLNNKQIKLGEKQNLINQLELERETLQQNIRTLSDIRANEKAESEMRIKNSETLINGIQRTLSFFRQRTIGDEDLDLDAILQITNLMGNIETSLQQTIPDEINSEKLAKDNYKSFIKTQNARLSQIKKEIDTLITDAIDSEKSLLMVQNDIMEENNIRESAEQMKSEIENLLRDLELAYDQTKALRAEQFKQLKALRTRIVEHSENSKKSMHKSGSF